jgi:DHA2 family multidrug resistance protein-like MFS transporter
VASFIAASQYTHYLDQATRALPPEVQAHARTSLADALAAAAKVPGSAGHALAEAAQQAFLHGIDLAVTVGGVLAVIAAFIVYRCLPRNLASEGSLHGPVEAVEDVAELGLAGVPPLFADQSEAL